MAAGYAPLSVGTETDGSLVCPAGRASVYTIKPTIGLISQKGLIPVSHTMDSAGPMAKTPYDIAAFLDILREEDAPGYPAGGYTSVLPGSMSEFSVAAVDYKDWIFPPEYMAPVESATAEIVGHALDAVLSEANAVLESQISRRIRHTEAQNTEILRERASHQARSGIYRWKKLQADDNA